VVNSKTADQTLAGSTGTARQTQPNGRAGTHEHATC